jgi:hypothetical protein
MDRCVGAAATMPGGDRKELAVQALARSATISDLSTRHGVSRKFVYQQANKARHALDDAFISTATDDTVLFQVQITKRWLRQVIVALALMCRGSYLGIIEFMRDLLGWPISIGTIHNMLHAAAEQASVINGAHDLSRSDPQRQAASARPVVTPKWPKMNHAQQSRMTPNFAAVPSLLPAGYRRNDSAISVIRATCARQRGALALFGELHQPEAVRCAGEDCHNHERVQLPCDTRTGRDPRQYRQHRRGTRPHTRGALPLHAEGWPS